MPYYTGFGASLQIGAEELYGTAVEPDVLVDLTSEGIALTVEKGDEGSLLASKTAMTHDLMAVTVSGSISAILRPEGAPLLFLLAMGGVDRVESAGDDGRYTHTLTLCGANEDLPGCTIVVDRRASVKKYAGCTVSSLSIEAAAGDYVKVSLDIQGVKEEPGQLNPALKSFAIPSYRCTAAVFKIGSEVYDITTSTVTIDNALETAPRTYASGLYAGRPQHGRRSVTVSFEIPYSSDVEDLKSDFLASEQTAAIELSFTSSNQDYSVKIAIPNLAVTAVSGNVSGTGILTASCEGEALSVGDVEPITVTITDRTATAYGVSK